MIIVTGSIVARHDLFAPLLEEQQPRVFALEAHFKRPGSLDFVSSARALATEASDLSIYQADPVKR